MHCGNRSVMSIIFLITGLMRIVEEQIDLPQNIHIVIRRQSKPAVSIGDICARAVLEDAHADVLVLIPSSNEYDQKRRPLFYPRK